VLGSLAYAAESSELAKMGESMGVYTVARTVWHATVPAATRRKLHVRLPTHLQQAKKNALSRLRTRDEIYNPTYYAGTLDGASVAFGRVIAPAIMSEFRPATVADIGCGSGGVLLALRECGVSIHGFEYATAGVEMCRSRGIPVTQFDITADPIPSQRLDLVISTEVAEHLPSRCADKFCDMLGSMAPVIVFTAATPGQGGEDHVNEQPHSYWIARFQDRGFTFDESLSLRWRADTKAAGVAHWYYENIMVFRRR
jgi:2-polyprenyl-3-methyl-5-hydroxy-6-metoxy-1,4-benzoquinol methylase